MWLGLEMVVLQLTVQLSQRNGAVKFTQRKWHVALLVRQSTTSGLQDYSMWALQALSTAQKHSNSYVVRCMTDALVFLLQVLPGSIISHFTSVQKCKNMLWLQNKLSPHFCMELIVRCVLYLCNSCYSSMVNALWSVFIDVNIIWLLFRLCVGGVWYTLAECPEAGMSMQCLAESFSTSNQQIQHDT